MAMGLSEYIAETVIGEMSGSTIMEDLLCRSNQRMPILGKLKRTEIIAVSCWVSATKTGDRKGRKCKNPKCIVFAAQASTANYIQENSGTTVIREIAWKKPDQGCYNLNTDAILPCKVFRILILNRIGISKVGLQTIGS
jgi:hypothetical protein